MKLKLFTARKACGGTMDLFAVLAACRLSYSRGNAAAAAADAAVTVAFVFCRHVLPGHVWASHSFFDAILC